MPKTKAPSRVSDRLRAKPTLSLKEACELLGISERTGVRLMQADKFPVPIIHAGPRTHRIPTKAVLQLLGEED